ncbi:neuronal acetylcholine receptor subunit alpha-10-like, partial [Paramuricea clavata]
DKNKQRENSKKCFWCYSAIYIFLDLYRLVVESTFDAKVRLERMLLKDYTKEVRPVLDVRDNVTVTVGISLYLIRNMDDKNQMLTTSLWIRQVWHDHRLTWTPSNFSSVKKINIPVNKVWIPDIKVYNEVNRGQYSGLDQFQTRVLVNHDGRIQWMGPSVMRTSCQVDIKMFPFDTQTCRIKLGSWTYDGFALDVKPESYTMDISKSPSSLEWKLVSTSVERKVQTYSCCPEPYPDVTYTLTIKRRQKSYVVNFIFPALFLTALTIMAFVTSAERIGLVLTCLVSMFFFLKMVAERTPPSDTVPLLSIYYVMLSFEVTLIFYAVCITLNAYHRQPALGGMSRCVRGLVMQKLGRIWGMDDIHNEIQEKLESLQDIANMAKSKYRDCEEIRTMDESVNKDHSRIYDEQDTNIELANTIEESGFGVNELEREDLRSNDRLPDSSGSLAQETLQERRDFSSSSQIKIRCETHQPSNSKAFVNIEESAHIEDQSTVLKDCINAKPDLPMQNSEKQLNIQHFQALHYCECKSCTAKPAKTRCSSFLNEMIALNHRLISNIQEINYLARTWDHKSSQKEQWLIAASILDKAFLILFLTMFVVFTLCNFIW